LLDSAAAATEAPAIREERFVGEGLARRAFIAALAAGASPRSPVARRMDRGDAVQPRYTACLNLIEP
jgi:hypothetical protein